MADEPNKPKDPAEGAGKAHKPTKAELAKLPGGEDFDAEGASSEDFEKHTEILRRRSVLAGLNAPAATSVATAAPTPDPTDIRAVNANGDERYFTEIAWKALETKGDHAGWQAATPKPSDI